MLPNYDFTEVGEKGISLSGGQKQRISICRLIYSDADVQIFDDPLSALDAHVGKKVFENVLKEGLKGRTRILVTHALHFLSKVDYVYVLEEGRVREQGKYEELIASGGAFAKFMQEFGSSQDKKEEGTEKVTKEKDDEISQENAAGGQTIMQAEERNTGAVTWNVYTSYVKAARGEIVLPLLFLSLALMQASNIVGSYWLVWWQEGSVTVEFLFLFSILESHFQDVQDTPRILCTICFSEL
jgi:ABC-type multidrug transport system ATPase subunit